MRKLIAPLQAQVVEWMVQAGDTVAVGQVLVVLEAMKMEHEIRAEFAGRVGSIVFKPGDVVQAGDALLIIDSVAATSGKAVLGTHLASKVVPTSTVP